MVEEWFAPFQGTVWAKHLVDADAVHDDCAWGGYSRVYWVSWVGVQHSMCLLGLRHREQSIPMRDLDTQLSRGSLRQGLSGRRRIGGSFVWEAGYSRSLEFGGF